MKNSAFKSCIICESQELKILHQYQRAHLCKCRNCGMIFTKKIPSLFELTNYYENYGSTHYKSEITTDRYNRLLDYFERYKTTKNILDIGCGMGYFLEIARLRGWNVYGSEYGKKLVGICTKKDIKMHEGSIQAFSSTIKFDVITSFEVIEHINSPLKDLKNINQLLRKGGGFYCTTPNFNSIMRYYLKDSFNVISYPEHLSYYTPKTLNNAVTKMGLKKKWIKTSGISITRLRTSQGKSKEKMVSKESADERLREKIEKSEILKFGKKIANNILSVTGLGMSIKALFEKTDDS